MTTTREAPQVRLERIRRYGRYGRVRKYDSRGSADKTRKISMQKLFFLLVFFYLSAQACEFLLRVSFNF
jgi:hypothetical protein